MKKPTQCQRIVWHIDRYGSIDDTEARNLYGIRRLAARIHDLKNAGYDIETITEKGKNRYGDKTEYARYVWHKTVL